MYFIQIFGAGTLGILCTVLHCEKNIVELENVQKRATQMIVRLEQLLCKETLQYLGFFCSENRLGGI